VFQVAPASRGSLFPSAHKVLLLAVSNLPGHLWSVEVVQAIVGSFEPAPQVQSVVGVDMSRLFVVD
jgi:hypothetical protein